MNKKGIVGLCVLIVAIIGLIFSGRGVVSDIDMQTSLSKLSDVVDSQQKAIADLTARIVKLESNPVKTIQSQVTSLPKLSTATVGIAKTNQKFEATSGQKVYLNAAGDKFHFWDGCTWYGYGTETTVEQAVSCGARTCMLCEMHKVIKQK